MRSMQVVVQRLRRFSASTAKNKHQKDIRQKKLPRRACPIGREQLSGLFLDVVRGSEPLLG